MRTPALVLMTMVTVLGATAADAQRLGGPGGVPGASYPVPRAGAPMAPPGGMPVNMPAPPMQTMPQRPYPGQSYPNRPFPQSNPQRPYPNQVNRPYPGRPYPGQNYPGQTYPRPWQGGGSQWGGNVGGHWSGGMNAPGGWNAYRRPSRGYRLPSYWVSSNFYIGDYGSYGLYAPPQGYGWQRYYDDAVLVDPRGRVRDSVYGLDWDGYARGGYDDYGYADYPPQYPSLPPVTTNGVVTTYSTGGGYAGGYAAGGYYYPGATTTVVSIQSAPSVTTTTTEYVETTRTRYIAPRHVYHAPKKRYVRPTCRCVRRPVEQPVLGS